MYNLFSNFVQFVFPIIRGASNLVSINATDLPILDGVGASYCFAESTNLSYINRVEEWDFSLMTDLRAFFYNTKFAQDLGNCNFNVNAVFGTNLSTRFITNTAYPPLYYSNFLKNLETTMIGAGRTQTKILYVPQLKYDATGVTARANLVGDGWTITDGGLI